VINWSVFSVAIGIFLTSLVFSMFGRGGGEFYLLFIISLLPIDYYTGAGITLFLIMLQGISMIAVYHAKHRLVDWGLALILGLSTGLSSFLGGYLSYNIPAVYLKVLFSASIMISAFFLYKGIWIRGRKGRIGVWTRNIGSEIYHVNLLYIVPLIVLVTFVAGMVGISGGGLIIPICILLGGVPIRVAMGTNTFLVLISSTLSFIGHAIKGGFNIYYGVIYGVMVILGSQIGSRLHVKINETLLRKIFSAILVIAASWMIIKIFI